jgi:hypothetical protein
MYVLGAYLVHVNDLSRCLIAVDYSEVQLGGVVSIQVVEWVVRPQSKWPWIALPEKRQPGEGGRIIVGFGHQRKLGDFMCALVVEPVHVDDDLGGSPRVQRVNEHLLDLTVAGFHHRVPSTADFHQEVHANKGVGPFVVMFGGCGA